MPATRSKNKKRITKISMKESVKEPIKQMKTRLMVISLKADDYIYKQKPISIQEADTYAREMEAFRTQCQDERYLQVIEKLTGYMKCIIREQAPKNIIDAKIINSLENPIEDAAKPKYNAIIDLAMERSFSNLSIATDPKDPLADMDNIDIHQEEAKIEHSSSAVTVGILKKVENTNKVAHTNKEPDTIKLPPKPVDKKQKEIVNESNVESQNILSNFEFENHTSLSSLRNYRNSANKQIQQSLEYAAIKITDSENTNTGNYTNKPEIININYIEETEIVDDNSKLSPNLLNDFYHINNSDAAVSQNNTNPRNYQTLHGNEISSHIANTINMGTNCSNKDIGNGRTKLEVINLKTIKQKELGSDSTKLSQNIISNFENGNYAVSQFLQNNLKSNQLLHVNERPNNISDARYKATKSSNMNIGKCDTKSKMSNLNDIQQKEKELDVSQNILCNFENEKYAAVGIVQNNTSSKNYQTKQMNNTRHTSNDDTHTKSNLVQHKTFKPSTSYDIQDNTIFKNNTQNRFMSTEMMQLDITNNPSQKQTNKIETRKKRKTSANNIIEKTEKKRSYNRKNKVNGGTTARNDLGEKKVDSVNQDAKHPENSDSKSKQKNQGIFLRKKIQEIDISWVENMKFVRTIETDEYFKFDSCLEESFWTDLSLPSNMSVTDFEYDQINIWKN